MTDMPEKTQKGVDAVDRALAVLRCYDDHRRTLSLTEISAQTSLYKSTVLRLAASLEQAGFLVRRQDKTFALGPELMRLGSVYARAFRLEEHIRPILRTLSRDTGESASFFRREGRERICLFREETAHGIRDHIREGDMLPLDRGAAGRVLTAFGSVAPTDRNDAASLAALPIISRGERDSETAAIAAPVFSASGLVGALSLSGPITRFTEAHTRSIAPQVTASARQASSLLGGDRYWS